MPTQTQTARFQSSKHDLATQALRVALEFERALAGMPPDTGKITDLAGELRAKAEPLHDATPFRLVEPGYLGTLGNLVRHYHKSVNTVEAVQEHVILMAAELVRFADQPGDATKARELREICLSLHCELLQELMSEEAPTHEWQRELHHVEAGVGSA